MVAFMRMDLPQNPVDRGEALERGRVKLDITEDVADAAEAVVRVLKGNTTYRAVDAVTLLEQELREVRAVLPRDACDQCNSLENMDLLPATWELFPLLMS